MGAALPSLLTSSGWLWQEVSLQLPLLCGVSSTDLAGDGDLAAGGSGGVGVGVDGFGNGADSLISLIIKVPCGVNTFQTAENFY